MDFISDYWGPYRSVDQHNVKIDNNPSLNVRRDPPHLWYDHGTPRDGRKQGDAFDRVMIRDGCTFPEAVKICKQYGIEPVKTYKYTDGVIVIRTRTDDGKSITLNKPIGKRALPLYRLDEAMCCDPIYIVEGEKNVDDLWAIGRAAVTSQGGANAAKKADWSVLNGKKTIIIPDCDASGKKYCDYILTQLPDSQIISLDGVDGYDISDYLTQGYLFDDLKPVPAKKELRHLPIGFSDKTITVYSTITKNYLEYSCRPSEIKQFLYRIVPDWNYWRAYCPCEDDKISKDACAEKLLLECLTAKNLTSVASRRGIGIYLDNGHIVANFGNRVFVDGKETQYSEIDSSHFYISIKNKTIIPRYSFEDAARFVDAICKTSIHGVLDKTFFLGGIVSGYLSGLPMWKTHIWIIAEPGAGKSSLAETALRPVCEPCDGHVAVGNITEAGIRQAIGNNSNIFVHDEAETSANIDKEIELIRASSSGGKIVKGTQDQRGIEYTCSSLFYLLSISSSIVKLSDDDRFVYVNMKQTADNQNDWESVRSEIKALANKGFFYSLYYRCSVIAKTYMESISVFRGRFIETIGNYIDCQQNRKTRAADKFASLICGRWHILNDGVITLEYCDEMIELISESPEVESIKADKKNSISTGVDALTAFFDTIVNMVGSQTTLRKLVHDRNNSFLSNYSMCVTVDDELFMRVKNKNVTKIFKEFGSMDYKRMIGGLEGVRVGTAYVKYMVDDMSTKAFTQHGILIPSKLWEEA